MDPIIQAVEKEVKQFLARIGEIPQADLVQMAASRTKSVYEIALKQAKADFDTAKRQVDALEDQAIKALTGENQLDLEIVNSMLVKHRAKMEAALTAMQEAEDRLQAEERNNRTTRLEIEEIQSWVERYDEITPEAKHMVIARLVDRIEVGRGYKVHIQMKVALEQLIGKTA